MVRNIIIGGVVVLLALLFLLFLTLKNRRQRREIVELDPEPLPELPAPATTAVSLPPVPVLPEIEPLPAPGEEILSIEKKRAQIGALANSEPAKTADFLRGMMDEKSLV
jgi:flagellar M-ring protein FliF